MTRYRYAPVEALFRTDAYKLAHIRQYDLAGTVTRIYSNYTNRKSRIKDLTKVVHFGLQAYIQQSLMDAFEPFFAADEQTVCYLYQERVAQVLGAYTADTIGTRHIADLHKLGYLPLRFCAVPEGSLVPIRVPSFTLENTHDDFAWLTNYVEPGLSAGVWQPSTSATIAWIYRQILDAAADQTGVDRSAVDYQCHDFSFRGMSSHESAAASAAGHLLSFKGTDSLVALDWIDRYYGGSYTAASVPATEHSVMSAGTSTIGELEMFASLLQLYPVGTVAIVSDTYDLWRVLTDYLPQLKARIMRRDGKLVIRPDSGDPEKILCGDPNAPEGHPAYYGVVRLLAETFGTIRNAAGFKELDSHIGVIYGDSITTDRAFCITQRLARMGFASTTVTLGVGSFSYQYQTRDTFSSAIKATEAEINGKSVNLFKDPVTDDGTKRSATGRLAVDWADDRCLEMVLHEKATPEQEAASLLQPLWEDGKFVRRRTFQEVREVLNT
jgi:nicotinic acid phosphoribosyltransferase